MKLDLTVHAKWNEWEKKYDYTAWCYEDMSSQGYTPVQAVSVEFQEPPHEVLVNNTVAIWKREQDRIQAEATAKVNELQRQINEMLCIEHKPETA